MTQTKTMTNNLVALPGRSDFTVEEALGQVLNEHRECPMQDVVIVGFDADGEVVIRSSATTRADANYLIDCAKMHAMGLFAQDDEMDI